MGSSYKKFYNYTKPNFIYIFVNRVIVARARCNPLGSKKVLCPGSRPFQNL